jgi:hypothetical protein
MRYGVAALALLAAVPASAQHPPSYGIAVPAQPQRQQRDLVVIGPNGTREVVEIDRNATDAEVAAIVADSRRRMMQRRP